MKVVHLIIISLPALIIAGVTGYWAVTESAWWLLGTAASLILCPDLTTKEEQA